ncbi:hypothetical protein SAMN04488056_10812 [Cohaesibacter marisflavi]|uniref:Uncharacterized protein n=1 Tax=Cohaesibacter marisflavi TaxID=655353 RepID=A0A1I5I2U4_9HYPH|nr:hypothetical protein [Cohaesibacter marisflavi]SFO54948.1 hypothetical protein SAMN04488056_10812 [Cohaesibacter marisflavi]
MQSKVCTKYILFIFSLISKIIFSSNSFSQENINNSTIFEIQNSLRCPKNYICELEISKCALRIKRSRKINCNFNGEKKEINETFYFTDIEALNIIKDTIFIKFSNEYNKTISKIVKDYKTKRKNIIHNYKINNEKFDLEEINSLNTNKKISISEIVYCSNENEYYQSYNFIALKNINNKKNRKIVNYLNRTIKKCNIGE